MMITMRLCLASALCAALFACSSNDTGGSSGTPAPSGTTPGGGTSGTPGSSGSSGAAAAAAAPKLDVVEKIANVLHVAWTKPTTKCDSIEAERMAEMPSGELMEKYKVLFTAPGDVDNKMDPAATADMKYTDRLRCKVGSKYSPYSNEVSGNPKQ